MFQIEKFVLNEIDVENTNFIEVIQNNLFISNNTTVNKASFSNSILFDLKSSNFNHEVLIENFLFENNDFHDNSLIFNCSFIENKLYLIWQNSKLKNNLFENGVWKFALINPNFNSKFVFLNMILTNNTFHQTLSQTISSYSAGSNFLEIIFQNFSVEHSNNYILKKNPQTIMFVKGSYMRISMYNVSFIQNYCYLGPCGFSFTNPINEGDFQVLFKSCNFSNNIVYYSEIDIYDPICIFSLKGFLFFKISQTLLFNNSVFPISNMKPQEKGVTCLISDDNLSDLYILDSLFLANKGSGIALCLYFKGRTLEITNSSFEKTLSLLENQCFVIALDCFRTNLTNVSFLYGKGGIIYFISPKEMIYFSSKNVSVLENTANFSSFIISVQKFHFDFIDLKYISNICFGRALFLYFYSAADEPENHAISFINSFFIDNSALNTEVGLFEIRAIGANITFDSCYIIKNSATGKYSQGGILYSNGETILIINFVECNIAENSAYSGALIYSLLSSFKFIACRITGNFAENKDGNKLIKA